MKPKIIPILFFFAVLISFAYAETYLGDSNIEWTFNKSRTDQYLNLEMQVLNMTDLEINLTARRNIPNNYRFSIAICNVTNLDDFTFRNFNRQYGKLSDFGLPSTWCPTTKNYGFVIAKNLNGKMLPLYTVLSISEKNIRMLPYLQVFMGADTELIDATATTSATALGAEENILIDSTGKKHFAWISSGSDLWYGNYTDGIGFSGKEIAGGFFNAVKLGMIADGYDNLFLYYQSQAFSPNTIQMRNSTNSGQSFNALQNIILGDGSNDAISPSCITYNGTALPESFWHCIASTNATIKYVNSTNFGTDYLIIGTSYNDSEWLDLEVDSNNNVCVVGLGRTNKDLEVWCSNKGWNTRYEIDTNVNGFAVIGDYFAPTMAVDMNDTFYIAYSKAPAINGQLKLAKFTANDPSQFTTEVIDTATSYFAEIGISSQKEIFLLYTDWTTLNSNSDIFMSNKSYKATTWSLRTQLHNQSGYPSIADSKYPISNRMTDEMAILFTNASSRVYYDNYSIPHPTYFPEPYSDWNIDCSDNVPLTQNTTIDSGYNVSFYNTGVYQIKEGVHLDGWSYLHQYASCDIALKNQAGIDWNGF